MRDTQDGCGFFHGTWDNREVTGGQLRSSKLSLPWSSFVPNFPISACLLFPISRDPTATLGQGTHGICFSRHFFVADRLGLMGWWLSFTSWVEKIQPINSDWNLIRIWALGFFVVEVALPKQSCQPKLSDFWDGSPHGWGSCLGLRELWCFQCWIICEKLGRGEHGAGWFFVHLLLGIHSAVFNIP